MLAQVTISVLDIDKPTLQFSIKRIEEYEKETIDLTNSDRYDGRSEFVKSV